MDLVQELKKAQEDFNRLAADVTRLGAGANAEAKAKVEAARQNLDRIVKQAQKQGIDISVQLKQMQDAFNQLGQGADHLVKGFGDFFNKLGK